MAMLAMTDNDGAPDFGEDEPIPFLVTPEGWAHIKALAEYGKDEEEETPEPETDLDAEADELERLPMSPKEEAAMSWTEIGAAIGVCRERAQQIGHGAMDKLADRIRKVAGAEVTGEEAFAAFAKAVNSLPKATAKKPAKAPRRRP
jgi:hypothetical protein